MDMRRFAAKTGNCSEAVFEFVAYDGDDGPRGAWLGVADPTAPP